MFNSFKLFFQILVIIQVMSHLLTGNGRAGTKLTMSILKIFQASLGTMFCVVTYIIKTIISLSRKTNKSRKKNIKKLSNKKCQRKIREYNKARNTVDIQNYIKSTNVKRKGLS